MKQGWLYKFLIAPLIFLLLYIGTILPFIGEGLRVLLQFLPQLLASAVSLLMTILAALTVLRKSCENTYIFISLDIFPILSYIYSPAVTLAAVVEGN